MPSRRERCPRHAPGRTGRKRADYRPESRPLFFNDDGTVSSTWEGGSVPADRGDGKRGGCFVRLSGRVPSSTGAGRMSLKFATFPVIPYCRRRFHHGCVLPAVLRRERVFCGGRRGTGSAILRSVFRRFARVNPPQIHVFLRFALSCRQCSRARTLWKNGTVISHGARGGKLFVSGGRGKALQKAVCLGSVRT